MNFASDNTGPVAPQVMEALLRANQGYAASYGSDEIMTRVTGMIREKFEAPMAAVYLVATGTAANALSLSILAQPFETIYCHRHAHIEEDECGAPEFFTNGAKLTLLEGENAKIDPDALQDSIARTGHLGVHGVQRGALSVSNVTEQGTIYSLGELRSLTRIAKSFGVGCHLDGARFANALVSLKCTPAELSWMSGFDVVSFGGTKNGLMGVEAVIIFDPEKAWEFELRRKRAGHLFSKHRYLSAQMRAYLTDDLWIRLAEKSNAAATHLAKGLKSVKGARLLRPQQANMLFCGWPRSGHKAALRAGARYHPWPLDHPTDGPDDEFLSARLVCNWSTGDADIDKFIGLIAK